MVRKECEDVLANELRASGGIGNAAGIEEVGNAGAVEGYKVCAGVDDDVLWTC